MVKESLKGPAPSLTALRSLEEKKTPERREGGEQEVERDGGREGGEKLHKVSAGWKMEERKWRLWKREEM